ncbi:MAG: type II toxin-antitoxin system HicA family toxin [Erysipelotrichaceae bacterium]|nr:type II toxin-antitoxin system HicA family toxin [Erysipelotrichaceae bacterium]
MPKKPQEMERVIPNDGWIFKNQVGSHRQYVHPVKKGKVTIPFRRKDLKKYEEKSILRQAGLNRREML